MRHVPTLLGRELAAYFFGPTAYLVLLAFQVIAWLNFWELVERLGRPRRAFTGLDDPMVDYISVSPGFWVALLVAVPALTMRLLAEEKRSGTIESLLTAPVSEAEVVVAKWLAGWCMTLTLLVPFALYLPFLYYQARFRFDVGPVAALGLGLSSLLAMFAAIGVFFSAVTKNQVVAAIGTFAALFLLIFPARLAYDYAVERRAPWAEAVRYISVLVQTNQFATGQFDLRYPAMHLSVAAFMLFLAAQVLRSRETTR